MDSSDFHQKSVVWVAFKTIMSDISGLNLPLDVKAKLAELDLELSEGLSKTMLDDDNVTPEAVVACWRAVPWRVDNARRCD